VGAGGWRSVFWFNLALGSVLLVAAIRYVPNSSDPQPGRLDVGGFLFGAVMLGSLIFAGISGEQYGYGTGWIIALFVLSGLSLLALIAVERHVRSPMIDARYLKAPQVSSALFVAFAVYFGIFSIFFFTALYLDLVVGYSGWQMAGVFAPMAAAIVIGSLVAGRWVANVGTRLPMMCGCALSSVGILLTRHDLTIAPSFDGLLISLGLAGLGFGIAVVPLTAAVLGYVPAARSGMAASATNTARQLGAVIGVAALGGLVTNHLTSDFGASLSSSGITGGGKNFILKMLETGGQGAAGIDIAHPSPIIKPLVDSATAAFRGGLHAALLVSAVLILVSAGVIALVPRSSLAPDSEY
ncbi:MAG TPA: MFS transporter, partial [Jatrophihabitantaceae bacterium]